ncbi:MULTISPECIES: lipopolysaccharide kinase InaA family protein [unclassified Lentimonas]|uniref:lipopolysaccharide kinase InaA family protein n=1 Tax=unclassified Lentimonas TaxID=2630993 RepID=UPI001389EEF0|nr:MULTISPECIES: lipopolysaccharide kinase InaA family protein [unclassified Lentimonas]
MKKTIIAPEWEQHLSAAGLLDIEALTTREFEWFEEPNYRMGGWSAVTRLCLNSEVAEDKQVVLFLKVQENHCYRTIQNGMRKRLSYEREMDAFEGLKDTGLLPDLLLFAKWRKGRDVGSIVITRALDGFVGLREWLTDVQLTNPNPDEKVRQVMASVGEAARVMHATGWAHFSFEPQHIFIGAEQAGSYPIRLIDLERARRPYRSKIFVTEDLSRLLRKSDRFFSREQKLQFLLDYFQTDTFSPKQLKWVKEVEQRGSLKSTVVDA